MDSKTINVGEAFRSQDLPSSAMLQALDYTAYPQGEKKIGVICQDGLMKRKADAEVYKTSIGVSSLIKGGSSPVAVGEAKPLPKGTKQVGVLFAVDKFFNWLNMVIGE